MSNKMLYEVIYPTLYLRIDALFSLLPKADCEYTAGDELFKRRVKDAFRSVGLPDILMTESFSDDELNFAREHLQEYGKFQAILPFAGRHHFVKDGVKYVIHSEEAGGPEKVYVLRTGEETDIDPSQAKNASESLVEVFWKYARMFEDQPFWNSYKREFRDRMHLAIEDKEYFTDFMSTYRACIDLGRDEQFLQRLRNHFETIIFVGGNDITVVLQAVFADRQEKHTGALLQNIVKWFQPLVLQPGDNRAAYVESAMKRIESKWNMIHREMQVILYLDLCRDMQSFCRNYTEGVPLELTQLLNTVSISDLVGENEGKNPRHFSKYAELENILTKGMRIIREVDRRSELIPVSPPVNRIALNNGQKQGTLKRKRNEDDLLNRMNALVKGNKDAEQMFGKLRSIISSNQAQSGKNKKNNKNKNKKRNQTRRKLMINRKLES